MLAVCGGALSADGPGEEMRIELANAVDFRRDFDALETGAHKCAAPLICGQEAWIGTDFGIGIYAGKAVQDLKDKLGVDWLIDMRAHTLANH